MILVIGAGVIGLATAAALARNGKEVLVVERESRLTRSILSPSLTQLLGDGFFIHTLL